MWQALTNLIKVKTLVTLIMTGIFGYLCVIGKIDAQQFNTIFSMVIAFYFGVQHEKKAQTETEVTEETK